ncbi:VCBS repeat-containing protein [Reichenbachiella agarivorans]|uniref:VCBS repeat-containing protein n=1 Tax=Reichenbachiella agarivorans TaxID=2979464 RepID=A0ABY6CRL6_9BACT|nr:VCBS repeat-containing protein [Reichenbachiella agarivorans]UXP32680.1 VCBS repeat-containing protein [Reichenbachiella agarivorans]
MKVSFWFFCSGVVLSVLFSCGENTLKRFEKIPTEYSQVSFSNTLTESDTLNYFKYPYLYMGGGVAIADFDNDGLQDLVFTGNMVSNRFYLNKGNLIFEDLTSKSGLAGSLHKWYTGVSIVDINADGYMDLYYSVAGLGDDRRNELYINNGDLTFTESAQAYGLADTGNSVQTSFFDYDHDGDLDVFVANYPITPFTTTNFSYYMWVNNPVMEKSDHFYRNDGNGHFTDVTEESGLLSFGLSLSASIVDFNQDGWDDIYVSNDFSTPDYFYINNGDGTFRNELKKITKQTAFYGMGTDAADVNNDGLIDLIQVDMSAADNRRSKANMASMNPALFWSTVNSGFHYQYMYNALQLNQGIVDSLPVMSNVAWISGVSSTDWSWTPLLADFDNDGFKDLYISNGTRKEINNRDFFLALEGVLDKASDQELKLLADSIPSEPIDNFMFRNKGGLGFEKVNQDWGVEMVGFSNGTSYADLDNDGDLDLVINNIDSEAAIFRNNSEQIKGSNYLRIAVTSTAANNRGYGSEVKIYQHGQMQIGQLNPVRGFQSAVEPILHFGLSDASTVDSLLLLRNGKVIDKQYNVAANQLLTLSWDQPKSFAAQLNTTQTLFSEVTSKVLAEDEWHVENEFNDFDVQVLLPHKMSNFGPALAVADVNQDGLEDFYYGAASGYEGWLFVQNMDGTYTKSVLDPSGNIWHEDLDAEFYDADNDGDLDLYIVSGGNQDEAGHQNYQDRLYLNDQGVFTRAINVLPMMYYSGGCVRPFDYDQDGDMDLFVGGRLSAHNYPYPGKSFLLENQLESGTLKYVEVTVDLIPAVQNVGMVTDAIWTDINGDQKADLIVVGEWMPIKVYIQTTAGFEDQSDNYFEGNTVGWWFSIDQADFDKDGDMDFVLGNMGQNYKYQASPQAPFAIYADDFDKNSKSDIVLSYRNGGKEYPVRGRQCSSQQIPAIKVAYKDYNSFSTASMQDIFGTDMLDSSYHFSVESFASVYIENQNGKMKLKELPFQAQFSSINDWAIMDVNQDGHLDIVSVGGLYSSEIETPRNDAGIGLVMLGNGKGDFAAQSLTTSGFLVPFDSKKIKILDGKTNSIVIANNMGPLQIFEVNR